VQETRVKDLMLPLSEYATVASSATLRDALFALSKAQLGLSYDRHHHRAVLVLDERGKVVGKLSHWAILRSLEPSFLRHTSAASLSRQALVPQPTSPSHHPSHFSGDLARMCRDAGSLEVKDVMVPAGESVEESARLMVAIHWMVLGNVQSMLVTRDGEVVGILRLADAFEAVADLIREPGDR
jgi:CBS domain-containing protein